MEKDLLRKVQLEQLEMAKEIKRVCQILDIPYILDCGTLLGAIRHQGFIPWDDDLDIGMLRSNYEKFLKEAPALLNKKYFLQTWYSDEKYGLAFAKLRKNNTVYVEDGTQNTGAHCGFYVDIFAYDICPKDEQKHSWQGKKYDFYRRCILVKCKYRPWSRDDKSIKGLIKGLFYLPFRIYAFFHSKDELVTRYEQIVTAFNREDSQVVWAGGDTNYGRREIPKVCLDKVVLHTFEDDLFSVPEESDLYLKSMYGDYMKLPPEDQRENRHGIVKIKFEVEE